MIVYDLSSLLNVRLPYAIRVYSCDSTALNVLMCVCLCVFWQADLFAYRVPFLGAERVHGVSDLGHSSGANCCAVRIQLLHIVCGRFFICLLRRVSSSLPRALLQTESILFFVFCFQTSLLLSSSARSKLYPQRPSGHALLTGVVPSPPAGIFMPSFLVRMICCCICLQVI